MVYLLRDELEQRAFFSKQMCAIFLLHRVYDWVMEGIVNSLGAGEKSPGESLLGDCALYYVLPTPSAKSLIHPWLMLLLFLLLKFVHKTVLNLQ